MYFLIQYKHFLEALNRRNYCRRASFQAWK